MARRRRRKAEKLGVEPPQPLVIDFGKPVVRAMALFVLVMTTANIAIIAGGTYKAVEVMDSTEFCGTSCYIMKPELTAYSHSPHARVGCVNCHIGPGASWFVKSKPTGRGVHRMSEQGIAALRQVRDLAFPVILFCSGGLYDASNPDSVSAASPA